MTGRKMDDLINCLEPHERGEVLGQLLKGHADLRDEASAIARGLLDDVSAERISKKVSELVLDIGREELGNRTGKKPWGYVEPSEAARGLLEEAIEGVQNDMKRRMKAGMKSASEKLCQGIVLGLNEVEKAGSDGVLGCAPEFPVETAAHTVSILVEMYPRSRRRAAGRRIIKGVEQHCEQWVEAIHRVVEECSPTGKRTRKRR